MPFPSEVPLGPEGGLPKQLEGLSRVPSQRREVGGVRVAISPTDSPPGTAWDPNFTWARLAAEVQCDEGHQAVEISVEAFEPVIESLSFQIQAALQLRSVTAKDVTPPVVEGEERAFTGFWASGGYPLRRFRPAPIQMAGVATVKTPDVALDLSALDDRHRAALDWYIKALAADYQVDQFMFLWIATEILSDESDLHVEAPYRARCHHVIGHCPDCGAPTAQPIRGQSHQRFLSEGFGVEPSKAREIWQARQIMHGAKHFDSSIMDRLADLSQVLRSVVNQALKVALDINPNDAPLVGYGALSIAPNMAMGGTSKVDAEDLAAL